MIKNIISFFPYFQFQNQKISIFTCEWKASKMNHINFSLILIFLIQITWQTCNFEITTDTNRNLYAFYTSIANFSYLNKMNSDNTNDSIQQWKKNVSIICLQWNKNNGYRYTHIHYNGYTHKFIMSARDPVSRLKSFKQLTSRLCRMTRVNFVK